MWADVEETSPMLPIGGRDGWPDPGPRIGIPPLGADQHRASLNVRVAHYSNCPKSFFLSSLTCNDVENYTWGIQK
jgi:hypothetical protein